MNLNRAAIGHAGHSILAIALSCAAVTTASAADLKTDRLAIAAESFERAMRAYENARFHVAQAHLQDAARSGHVRAHEVLGFMYLLGQELYPGVDRDRPRALKHFLAAAQAGSTKAAFTLCAIAPRSRHLAAVSDVCPTLINEVVAALPDLDERGVARIR